MRQVAYRPGVEHDTRRLVSVLFGPFRAFQDAHPAALVGRGRADQDERQDHARAAHGEYVGDGVAGEERAEKHILSIFFRPNSIIPSSPNTLPSSSASGMSATCTPQVQLASLTLLRHNLAWARISASLASCFACARAACAAGSAHEAHGLVVLEPGEQAHERPRARAADPRAGEARGAKDRRTRGVRPRTRPQSTRAAR